MPYTRKLVSEPNPPGYGAQFTIPSPFLGLNTRDSFNVIRPDEARVLENWLPDNGAVKVRPGFTQHANTAPVSATALRSLFTLKNGTSSKLFAAGNGRIADVTGTASRVSNNSVTYSSDIWSTENLNGYVIGVNGTDTPWRYEPGKAYLQPTTFYRINPLSNLRTVSLVKNRLWFTLKNSADVCYAGLSAVGGELILFPLSQIASGGRCVDIGHFSLGGAGTTPLDQTVFIMDTGQIIAYVGDPAITSQSSGTFSLVGKFTAPTPISSGYGCKVNVGGDLVILTVKGPVPFSAIAQGNAFSPEALGVWGKISPSWSTDYANFGSNDGWSAFFANGLVYFNINTGSATTIKQYVLNTVIPAWTTYTNLPVSQFAAIGTTVYFGSYGSQNVRKHNSGADNGASITATARQGFSYPINPGVSKHYTSIRPSIVADGQAQGQFQVDTDFVTSDISSATHTLVDSGSGADWGAAWGTDWATSPKAVTRWWSLSAFGKECSPVVRVYSTAENLTWQTSTLIAVPAGIF